MKPEVSIPVALATAAVVVGVYSHALPSQADQRTLPAGTMGSEFLASSERQALLTSVAVAAGISLIAKDSVPFILGGLLAVGLAWQSRVAREVNPTTNKIDISRNLQGERYTVQATA